MRFITLLLSQMDVLIYYVFDLTVTKKEIDITQAGFSSQFEV